MWQDLYYLSSKFQNTQHYMAYMVETTANWCDTHIKDLKIDKQHKSNDRKGSLMNNTEIQIKVRFYCLKVPINIWKQQQTQETNISEPAKPQTKCIGKTMLAKKSGIIEMTKE